MAIGIVSAGFMGAGLGGALRDGGARVVTTLDGRSQRTRRLAEAAGLEVLESLEQVVAAAGTILVVTPPDQAAAAADAIANGDPESASRDLPAAEVARRLTRR